MFTSLVYMLTSPDNILLVGIGLVEVFISAVYTATGIRNVLVSETNTNRTDAQFVKRTEPNWGFV